MPTKFLAEDDRDCRGAGADSRCLHARSRHRVRGRKPPSPIRPAVMNAVGRERPIKLAVLAVGGQGGGVITDWITDVAERNG